MKNTLFTFFILSSIWVQAADRPNILFIFADDVGQEVLQCYGGQSYQTPHLDELARTGMKFNHAYSMPVCHPSRLTLMSGKYPFRHGKVTWGDYPKKEEAHTFSRYLQKAGYTTAIAGKWQMCLLKDDPLHPRRMGFDHWDLFGWHEGPRFYEPMIYHNGKVRDDTLGHYGPDLYVRSLIEFIKANRDRPFLAGLFYSGEYFFSVEFLAASVFLDHIGEGFFNTFVGCEPLLTAETFASAARTVPFFIQAGVDDFIFKVGTGGTFHRESILRSEFSI